MQTSPLGQTGGANGPYIQSPACEPQMRGHSPALPRKSGRQPTEVSIQYKSVAWQTDL
jgi:hypothetical protein